MVNFLLLLKGGVLFRCQIANNHPNRPVVRRGKGGIHPGCPMYCQWCLCFLVNKGWLMVQGLWQSIALKDTFSALNILG